ncbi:uncharacterized protein LOC107877980 isoform X8 [Capsicum annuum]|uniref:uncharacterized protein LOC107877980 isoform X7 n=1 Tax=Capsicum annuum TaxID=4072 RepID=UPI001FB0D93B|nr:uncharacterized protein LOC107877980 isoform X7 [Capsicum annuum]XP_047249780.1 uncharacterized protein LOC107877980 isoform X8 [Capsicum annuum]
MANRFGVKLQSRLPNLAGIYPFSVPIKTPTSVPCSAETQKSRVVGKKKRRAFGCRNIHRRVLLGIGVSLWSQFLSMAGNVGSKSFMASARQKGEIEQVLKNVEWPKQFPFKDEDFQRFDESSDTLFYEMPRFVTHIDDQAISALTKYYSEVLPSRNTPGVAILDMCSSWVSHYPSGYKQERMVGMGMNEEELKRNPVSVDYLTKPLDVFKEMSRVLKPGGLAIMSFSNRCFWTKAISIWTSTGNADHVMIVGSYFHYAGGFEPPQAVDISPNPGRSDPMYIVYSRKIATA